MAQNSFSRALPLPRGFDGSRPELWKDFDYKRKAYLNMQEPDFSSYMNIAAASLVQVTDERLLLEVTVLEVVGVPLAAKATRSARAQVAPLRSASAWPSARQCPDPQ